MNFIYLSPHFPENYIRFCVALNSLGVKVLGIADEDYNHLNPLLKAALTEYYKVEDMEDYDQILRAVGYFTHKYGKIDRIDSLNEHWLETEAKIRTDFNIFGFNKNHIKNVKYKSLMKQQYLKAGIKVAAGTTIKNLDEANSFIKKHGFPVIIKPDKGVGATNTFKLKNQTELAAFFRKNHSHSLIIEEFISGQICSFDGLTNKDGEPVFYTAHVYSIGVMDAVNEDTHISYYSLREIPEDLERAGLKVLSTFAVKERFFHFEFFRSDKNNELIALEVNMRPPGGLTTDMFNFANDINIYQEWANIMVNNNFQAQYNRKYHCGYVGRKERYNYKHPTEEILAKFTSKIIHHEPITSVFSPALGNYGFLVRSSRLKEIKEMVRFIQEK